MHWLHRSVPVLTRFVGSREAITMLQTKLTAITDALNYDLVP
jgi:hypothetical protein